ncbi:hypothetical protein D3C85_457140 [compost metagenome]
MSVFINSKQAVIDYINAVNAPVRITPTNVKLSKPYEVSGGRYATQTLKNTWSIVEPDGTPLTFRGRKVIFYNRLDLADFARFRPVRPLKAPKPTSVHGMLAAIQYYFAIKLSVDDVEDDPTNLDVDGVGTVTVRAKATSPLWIGSITFDVLPGGLPLEEYLTNITPDQIKYPIDNFKTGSSAAVIAYPLDATPYRDNLLIIEEGLLHGTGLATVLEAMLTLDTSSDGKTLWNSSVGSLTWSLEGATVFYNGLNEAALPTNPAFKYVIGIELRGDLTIPSGRFYLHYSDPEDASAA